MNYPAASYGVSKVKEPLDRSKLRGIEPRVINFQFGDANGNTAVIIWA